jgi:hypothetical protein
MALLPSLDDHGPRASIHGAPLDQSRRAWELGDDLLHLAYQASLLQATPLVGAEMLHIGQLLAFRQPPEDGDKPPLKHRASPIADCSAGAWICQGQP